MVAAQLFWDTVQKKNRGGGGEIIIGIICAEA